MYLKDVNNKNMKILGLNMSYMQTEMYKKVMII